VLLQGKQWGGWARQSLSEKHKSTAGKSLHGRFTEYVIGKQAAGFALSTFPRRIFTASKNKWALIIATSQIKY
jgi:hypothetical protein